MNDCDADLAVNHVWASSVCNNKSFFHCIKFVGLEEIHRTARNDCDELGMQIWLKSLFHCV